MQLFVYPNKFVGSRIKTQFSRLQDRLSDSRQETEELRRTEARKDDLISTQETQILHLKSELNENKNSNQTKETALNNMLLDLEKTKEDLIKNVAQSQNLLADNESLKLQIEEGRHENEMLTDDVKLHLETIERLNNDIDIRDTAVQHLREDIGYKDSELNSAGETISKHEGQIEVLEDEIRSLQTRLKTAKLDHDDELFKLRDEMNQTKLQHQQAVQKSDAYSAEIVEMNKVVDDYVRQIEKLTQQCETAHQELDKKRAEMSEMRLNNTEKVAGLESELMELTGKVAQGKEIKMDMERKEKELSLEIEKLKEAVKNGEISLATEEESHEIAVAKLKREVKSLESQLDKTRKNLDNVSFSLKESQTYLAELSEKHHQELASLNTELDYKLREIEHLNRRIAMLEGELSDSKTRQREISETLVSAQERHREVETMLSNQIEKLQGMYAAKEQQVDDLNENMSRQIDHLLEQKHEALSSRDELGAAVERMRGEAQESRGVIERQAAQLKEVMLPMLGTENCALWASLAWA